MLGLEVLFGHGSERADGSHPEAVFAVYLLAWFHSIEPQTSALLGRVALIGLSVTLWQCLGGGGNNILDGGTFRL